ncbi:MAG: hypothetical protein GVY22_10365 [Gammaproteobacteria bacterium]|jgi:hypothetical protein|nr:hypothetical protein [Gammaproteobacteria bacterium]
MTKLPVWVQHQLERQRRSQERLQRGCRVVRLDPSFAVTVPAVMDGSDLVVSCSGCTSPKGCQKTGRCASLKLDGELMRARKGPVAWARAKLKHVKAEAKGELHGRILEVAQQDPRLDEAAEHRHFALHAAAIALRDTSEGKEGFKRWFPSYRLAWSAYPSGLFADRTSRYWWVDKSFRWWLTSSEPARSELHPWAKATLSCMRKRLDEHVITEPDTFELWSFLQAVRTYDPQSLPRVQVQGSGASRSPRPTGDGDAPPWWVV